MDSCWVVVRRGAIVGVPSVAAFWAYLGLASLTGSTVAYVLGVLVAALVAVGGVTLAQRVGLTQPWLVCLGTPVVVAMAALVGTLAGGGLNDAGGGWREALGWALVALLAYPAVAVVGEAGSTRGRILAVLAVAVAYALMLGYVQLSLPGWRETYYLRHAVPMVAVEVPGFELSSARAYPSELVVWLRGRPGQLYAGSYLRAEVYPGVLDEPTCGGAVQRVAAQRVVCPSGLIIGLGTRYWFRLAEPNGTAVFKKFVVNIARAATMRPVAMSELVCLPIAAY